jgi:hypothetical protein
MTNRKRGIMRRLAVVVLSLSLVMSVLAGGAWAQTTKPKEKGPDPNKGYEALGTYIFWRFFAPVTNLDDIERIRELKKKALDALRYRQPKEFRAARKSIEGYTDDVYRPSIRSIAREALADLPKTFVPGFAYMRDDGTVAADPDTFIRAQLRRDRYANEGGDNSDAD